MAKPETRAMVNLYGERWDAQLSPVNIEIACIRNGGQWQHHGKTCGLGLYQHYLNLERLLWPNMDFHRWAQLCLKEMVEHSVVVLMGPKSSGKTSCAAMFALCEYWIEPANTLVLMSSTDLRSLKLRIWGECKMLFAQAKERYPFLAGHLVESMHAISTDNIDEAHARDLRKGIIGVPCVEGGRVMNLKKFQGIKQKRMIVCGDEASAMAGSWLSAFSNLDANPYFKAIILGNPETMQDPLGRAAEPREGWDRYMSPERTMVWDTRFMNGRCVNLIGTDSPNFDFPQDKPARYPYLISKKSIDSTAAFFTRDSMEYHSQCVGDMQISQLARQVVTRQMCEQYHAMEVVVWGEEKPHRIYAIDAAYGGDRCVGGFIEWGRDVKNRVILNLRAPLIIPVSIKSDKLPEDQIAEFVMLDCQRAGIDPEHVYFDATGRGSLGTSFARLWSNKVNPIEFGAPATERPVSDDMYVFDGVTRQRRLMLCKERYDRFVTELWFSVRLVIESNQMRGLTEDVMDEFTMRYWDRNKERYCLETKRDMKERVGRSPDLADWCVIAVEGARREGFTCHKLLNDKAQESQDVFWENLQRSERQIRKAHTLNYRA